MIVLEVLSLQWHELLPLGKGGRGSLRIIYPGGPSELNVKKYLCAFQSFKKMRNG